MADFTLQALHDEIEADPQGIGYKVATVWKGDQEIADLLNDPANGATVRRQEVSMLEIKQTVEQADFQNLSPKMTDYVSWLVQGEGELDVTPDNVFNGLIDAFGAVTGTGLALMALFEKAGSRAEVLWGEGTLISLGQVAHAANL